jgi:hypothetical protein
MKRNRIITCCLGIVLTFNFSLAVSQLMGAVKLYGITDDGLLITVDTSTANVTTVGSTGISQVTGLTYNLNTGLLYATTNGIGFTGQIYTINPDTAEATRVLSTWGDDAIAYRFVDDRFYCAFILNGSTEVELYDTYDSDIVLFDIFVVADKAIQGLAVRPSDGVLFGAGLNTSFNETWLFKIDATRQSNPAETIDIGATNDINALNRYILDIAFHPDGRLYGTDGNNLVRINTTTGAVENQQSFGVSPVTGLAFVTPHVAGPVDIWIKDCPADTGDAPSVPTPCEVAYKSPDIWVDNNEDMIIDEPVYEATNSLKARIRNRQSGTARDVIVKFYYRDNTTGLHFPEGAELIGEDKVTILPNGTALASVPWYVPHPPTTGGHWCIGVTLDHPDDPLPVPAPEAYQHNNIAIANIWFIASRVNEPVLMSFTVATGGSSGFGLLPWPREFIIKVKDELPPGWDWTIEGAPVGTPFILKLGEERQANLKVQVPMGSAPHSGGSIEVQQVDVTTGLIVGGLSYNLYEDHRPPEKVRAVRANTIDGYAVLTWDKVIKESETGLRERVAYYEVLRDGKVVDKVLRDGDPYQPGIQWRDPAALRGRVTYILRVVDEGGNISELSPEVTVSPPCQEPSLN